MQLTPQWQESTRRAEAVELQKLRHQADNDAKERRAVKTILDVKIMGLVDNVARCFDPSTILKI